MEAHRTIDNIMDDWKIIEELWNEQSNSSFTSWDSAECQDGATANTDEFVNQSVELEELLKHWDRNERKKFSAERDCTSSNQSYGAELIKLNDAVIDTPPLPRRNSSCNDENVIDYNFASGGRAIQWIFLTALS